MAEISALDPGTRNKAGDLLLGLDIATKELTYLSHIDRARHMLVLGKTGTGKSNLLLDLLSQTIEQGFGFCLIDPFGQLTERLMTHIPPYREQDVVLLDLSDTSHPFGLNIFEPGATPADVTALFQKVWGHNWGTLIQKWLSAITYTFTEAGEGTLADIPRLFTDDAYRSRLLKKVKNFQARMDWQRATKKDGSLDNMEIGSTSNRISLFLYDDVLLHIVGQQRSTLDFAQLIREGKIVLCKLAAENKETQALIGTLIMQRLTKAILGTYREKPFYVFCDEFQRFATPDMVDLISGGRQFSVGLTLATQNLAQIKDEFIRSNLTGIASTLAFTLTPEDASMIARILRKLPGLPPERKVHPEPYKALLHDQYPLSFTCHELRSIDAKLEAWSKDYHKGANVGERQDRLDLLRRFLNTSFSLAMHERHDPARKENAYNNILADMRFLDGIHYYVSITKAGGWACDYFEQIRDADLAGDTQQLTELRQYQAMSEYMERRHHQNGGGYGAPSDALEYLEIGLRLHAIYTTLSALPLYEQEEEKEPTTADLVRSLTSLEADNGKGVAVAKLISQESTIITRLMKDADYRSYERIRDYSRRRYTRPRQAVSDELFQRLSDAEDSPSIVQEPELTKETRPEPTPFIRREPRVGQ